MASPRKTFSAESTERISRLQIERPSWRRNISARLLTSNHPAVDKLIILGLDEGATGNTCRWLRATVAEKTRQTEKTVRNATDRLTRAGYLSRRQTGPRTWVYELKNRQPSTWLPGWSLNWYRSDFFAILDVPPSVMVLWALAIQHTPSAQLRERMPHLGPWCEVSMSQLARELKVSVNSVSGLIEFAGAAGILLSVQRPNCAPILYPITKPISHEDRLGLLQHVISLVEERDRPRTMKIYGKDGLTVWDDDSMSTLLAKQYPTHLVVKAWTTN